MKKNFPIIYANVTEAKTSFKSVCWHEIHFAIAFFQATGQKHAIRLYISIRMKHSNFSGNK